MAAAKSAMHAINKPHFIQLFLHKRDVIHAVIS